VGSLVCEKPVIDWSLCKPGDLFEFHVDGLPTEGDRSAADTEVKARQSTSADGENFVLEGDASIQQLDQLIRADRFTYARSSNDWSANGNVRYQDRDLLLGASDARGNTASGAASLNQVRYQLLSSRGNGRAATVELTDSEHAKLGATTFSTCPLDSPGWQFRADSIELDQANGVGVARDVSFRVAMCRSCGCRMPAFRWITGASRDSSIPRLATVMSVESTSRSLTTSILRPTTTPRSRHA
jgi:LPS-assembly protein